jgi:hypothetical protein
MYDYDELNNILVYKYQYFHVYECDSEWGLGLHVGFIDHFNTQLVIALNYGAIANFHTL